MRRIASVALVTTLAACGTLLDTSSSGDGASLDASAEAADATSAGDASTLDARAEAADATSAGDASTLDARAEAADAPSDGEASTADAGDAGLCPSAVTDRFGTNDWAGGAVPKPWTATGSPPSVGPEGAGFPVATAPPSLVPRFISQPVSGGCRRRVELRVRHGELNDTNVTFLRLDHPDGAIDVFFTGAEMRLVQNGLQADRHIAAANDVDLTVILTVDLAGSVTLTVNERVNNASLGTAVLPPQTHPGDAGSAGTRLLLGIVEGSAPVMPSTLVIGDLVLE